MDVRITLETLYDILRNEKKKAELQKLPDTFFPDVVAYVRQKQSLLESTAHTDDVFLSGERAKLEYELRSILRIVKEIYEKREKKIIDIALNRSRTQSDVVDTRSLLAEEREMYRSLMETFDLFRKGILVNLMKGLLPTLSILEQEGRNEHFAIPTVEHQQPPIPSIIIQEEEHAVSSESLEAQPLMKKIKFLQPVPDFIWTDLKEYGPFNIGDQTEIWPEVADLLIKKGQATEVGSE